MPTRFAGPSRARPEWELRVGYGVAREVVLPKTQAATGFEPVVMMQAAETTAGNDAMSGG